MVWQRDPRLVEYFWIRYNLGSFLGSSGGADINHRGPLWLYPMTIAMAFVPWTVPVLAALGWQGAATWSGRRDPALRLRLFLISAVVFPLLMLSVSSSKLETYVLPLFPCIALLAADAWRRAAADWWRWLLPMQGLVVGLAIIVAVLLAPRLVPATVVPQPWHPLLLLAAAALAAGQLLGGWWWWRGRFAHGAIVAGAGLVLATCLVLPALDRLVVNLHPSTLARQVAAVREPFDLVAVYHDQVHEYDLVRELGRLPIVAGAREVGMGHFVEVVPPPTPIPAESYFLCGDNLAEQSGLAVANPWLLKIGEVAAAVDSERRVWLFADALFAQVLDQQTTTPLLLAGRCGRLLLLTNRPPPWPMPEGGKVPPFVLRVRQR
jgi:4-amino-4-deoxy-L-arabinose transferase-like glycosyltransferase